ncbi:MAG TPA: peroxiredoxin [Rhabdochlamydiaceae bacterium]|nr:peroxiredoxin [Rhabdochlamydiaceae bacterium]
MNSLLVGKQAPDFVAKAVIKNKIVDGFSLKSTLGKYCILFFYPLDFTFVCPTEIHAFQGNLEEFKKRECEVIGCSVDSCYAHLAWAECPKSKGGIEGVEFPLISDLNKEIARKFHVLKEEDGISYRGLFLIDKEGVIRHQQVNDLPIGRNVGEVIRLLDALIHYEKNGEVCPANWEVGEKSLEPTQEGLIKFFSVK